MGRVSTFSAGYCTAKEMPMDIEWAKDGISNELYIVQARPETVQSQRSKDILETYHLGAKGPIRATGMSVGEKIGAGKARIIRDASHLSSLRPGEVLLSHTTTPDWEPAMKIASAIVTNTGGRTSHAAIVSREFGIPAIVGTDNATEKIRAGEEVTVSCAEGEKGFVYGGKLPYHVEKISLKGLKRPKTEIRINLGNPDEAFAVSAIPNDGCGLARLEFIIGNYIKIHPMALAHPEKVKDEMAKNGLKRGENGLEIFMMCEIPSNVVLIDEFCNYVDGISIGSNDLTQLALGVDRDSEVLAREFDERDAAVMDMVSKAIQGARKNGKHSALDGQAPGDYPEYAQFLVREGISSISLVPDSVMKITLKVLDIEKKLGSRLKRGIARDGGLAMLKFE